MPPETEIKAETSLIGAAEAETKAVPEPEAKAEPEVKAEPEAKVEPAPPPAPAKTAEAASTEGSLISEAAKPKEEPAKAEPAAKAAEPEAPPEPKNFVYEDFKVPDGFEVDKERVGLLQTILTEAFPTQESAQKVGQQLIDLYVAEQERLATAQRDLWKRTNDGWRDEVRADPELGGNRINTTLLNTAKVISTFGGKAEEQAAIRDAFNLTGAGNHPALIRLFNRIGEALGTEGQLVPAPKPAAQAVSRAERRYGKANGAAQQQS